MKKTLFSLVAMCVMFLLASCGGNSLEGTWKVNPKDVLGEEVSQFDKCEMLFTFDGGNVDITLDCSGTTGQNAMTMDLGFTMDIKGKYKQKDQELTLDFNGAKPEVDIYKFKINADEATQQILASMGMDEKTMKKSFQEQIEGSDFTGEMAIGKLTIKSLEGDKMVLENEGKEVNLTRK